MLPPMRRNLFYVQLPLLANPNWAERTLGPLSIAYLPLERCERKPLRKCKLRKFAR